ATDATGHVYAWQRRDGKLELSSFVDGTLVTSWPSTGPLTLWPDPTGKQLVAITGGAVSQLAPDGTQVWTRELSPAHRAAWLRDGGLVIVHATGLVKLAPATGAVETARCGWGFGLASTPHPFPSRVTPVCAQ